jgi:predicted hydrocarbon binding protein
MSMDGHGPQVPIAVDPETGVWTTDNLPMIYVPQHFFVNNHMAVEDALGREAYAKILYDAGYKSAWYWCEKEAATHGLGGLDVFRHYMKRISQRGWGQFTIEDVDSQTGAARVRLDHSVFVYHYGKVGRRVCYMFAGWFPGSLEWAGRNLGQSWKISCVERQCAAEAQHDHCIFDTLPA